MDACKPRQIGLVIRASDRLDLGVEIAGYRRIIRPDELRKDDAGQEIVEAGVPRLFHEEMLVDLR